MNNIFDHIINKLLSKDAVDKHFFIVVLLVIFIGLNLLGIDIEYLTESPYVIVILIIINIIITLIIFPITTIKLKILNDLMDHLNEFSNLTEDFKEDYDLIKNLIQNINITINKVAECTAELSENIKGIPNIKFLKIFFELKTKALWNEIFKECLKYLLTYDPDKSQESRILFNTLEQTIKDIEKKYLKFIHKNIKNYDANEKLTEILKNKINNNINKILNEIEKNKKITEKLYIISLLLKDMEEELNSEILIYLRSIQTNISL